MVLAGCVSTPTQRIAQHQALFDSFPAEVREQIRRGQVELGFTPEMVQLALGPPQQQMRRRTTETEDMIWLYTDRAVSYDRQRVDIDGLTVTGPGGSRSWIGGGWLNLRQEREILRRRIEFQNGRVVLIEESAPVVPAL